MNIIYLRNHYCIQCMRRIKHPQLPTNVFTSNYCIYGNVSHLMFPLIMLWMFWECFVSRSFRKLVLQENQQCRHTVCVCVYMEMGWNKIIWCRAFFQITSTFTCILPPRWANCITLALSLLPLTPAWQPVNLPTAIFGTAHIHLASLTTIPTYYQRSKQQHKRIREKLNQYQQVGFWHQKHQNAATGEHHHLTTTRILSLYSVNSKN